MGLFNTFMDYLITDDALRHSKSFELLCKIKTLKYILLLSDRDYGKRTETFPEIL